VTVPAGSFQPERLDDWASRRSGRLLHRTLAEFTGHGSRGGEYRFPLCVEIQQENLGLQLVLHVNPKVPWSDGSGMLTGADVSRHLLAMADPDDKQSYRQDWAELLAAVSVRDGYEVQIDLRRAHVHPEGMLRTVLIPWHSREAIDKAPALGPFVLHQVAQGEHRYRANEQYFAAGPGQPKEIIERHFKDGRTAALALRNGEVAMLDRVNPWEIERLKAAAYLHVEPYAVPTVHCLVPHPDNKLLARRALRRAIISGIHRDRILKELLGGALAAGNMVVSGPFPAGRDATERIGYAYDREIPPRPYDRALAVTLFNVAIGQENAARKKRQEAELTDVPPLVLLHPPQDIARVACRAIRDQLALAGLRVNLKEQNNQPANDSAYDLKYVELAMWEPLVDASRVLGPDGVSGRPSSYITLALRELDRSNNWPAAMAKLLEIHRLTYEELPILPLWQLTDHFAYHRQLQGVAAQPVSLYHNVEQWQSPPAVLQLSP
jgi:ABC-type transport system substrate-binding protein